MRFVTLADFVSSHHLTHEAFAQRAGLGRVAVTRYLLGTRVPDREAAVRIERATGGAVTVESWSKRRRAA